MLRKCLLFTAFLSLWFYSPAMATVVEYAFDGKITGVGLPVFGINPTIGSAVTGSFSYDTALTTTSGIPFFASYQVYPPYALVAFIDGRRIESSEFFNVDIQNNFGGNVEDTLNISTSSAVIDGTQTLDVILDLSFASTNPNTFADLSLPGLLNLSDFNAWHYGVLTRGNNQEIIVFSVDQLTQVPQVPEPSTWLLFGSGLACLAAWRYRRNYRRLSA
jgi:hypothetical protein